MPHRIFDCIFSEFHLEYIHMLRYREWIIAAMLYPVIFASIPIFLGTWLASGAEEASMIFEENVGTEAYSTFLLVGANMWFFVMTALWDFGLKLRKEQASGVLEDIYIAAGNLTWPLFGSGLFGIIQCMAKFIASMAIGSVLYGTLGYVVSPNFLYCLGMLAMGLVGVYGLSFMIGALVLRVKEAFSLLVILQMLFGIVMGVFYPVSFLPYWLRLVSYALPMTIALNDMRALLLSTQYVLDVNWDALVILCQSLLYVTVGAIALRRSERGVRRGAGLASL